jgi:transcriptional regulator with XRE-family HTH domain
VSDSGGSSSTEADGQEEEAPYPWLGRQDWTDDDWNRWLERNPWRRDVGPDFDQIVGENVQRFRTAAGLTQAELAAALSAEGDLIHQQTVQKVEKGLRPLKYSEAVRISNALNVSPTQLADSGDRAVLNARFLKAIAAANTIRTELKSTADRLASRLVELAELLGLANIRATSQPDAYLVEEAEWLVKTNWGRDFNQSVGEALRDHLSISGVLEDVDAPTYLEILQNLIVAIQPIKPGDPLPPESWRDESDT